MEPFTIAGYVVMVAAGLSVLNVFVLGLVQRKRERAALRAIGVLPRQEQVVVIAHASLLALLVALMGGLGGVALRICGRLARRSPTASIAWGVPELSLRTGVSTVFVLVLAAAGYPVIHSRRLETADVLRSS